ncbi:MAG TPA: CBS domain-containing protein [Syntrophobacteria bacterium]|nr:CBS domain-containing protein [Syntrophobacteria bacterium]
MKAEEFMTPKVESIDADSTVYDAIERMVNKRLRSLLVTPRNRNRDDYGVITARDVVFRVLSKGLDPADVKTSQISSKPLRCVEKDADLVNVAALMEKHNIARVFVCDGEKIVGLVSLLDVMAAALIEKARKGYAA